jgi:hypothetical protein
MLQEFSFIFGNCGRLLFLKSPVSHSPLVPNPFQIIKMGLSMESAYSLLKPYWGEFRIAFPVFLPNRQ